MATAELMLREDTNDTPESITLTPPAGCTLTPTGMTISESVQIDEWVNMGRWLALIKASHQWWIGDWLRFGERKYGEITHQFADEFGFSPQTLMNYGYVADAIEVSRRREKVSWTAHAEVASLPEPEREEWLDKVEANEIAASDLRHLKRVAKVQKGYNSKVEELDAFLQFTDRACKLLRELAEECPRQRAARYLLKCAAQLRQEADRTPEGDISRILAAIKNHQANSIEDIADDTDLDPAEIETYCEQLVSEAILEKVERGRAPGARGQAQWLYMLVGAEIPGDEYPDW